MTSQWNFPQDSGNESESEARRETSKEAPPEDVKRVTLTNDGLQVYVTCYNRKKRAVEVTQYFVSNETEEYKVVMQGAMHNSREKFEIIDQRTKWVSDVE